MKEFPQGHRPSSVIFAIIFGLLANADDAVAQGDYPVSPLTISSMQRWRSTTQVSSIAGCRRVVGSGSSSTPRGKSSRPE